ncbi:kinase-like protein [Serendipita vermifera]|nr:kinase-like protein [Serendipita vermifera]
MLLQAACLAKLGNRLRKEKQVPFIVSAIYIDNNLLVKWYLVYQPDVSKVEYVEINFDLRNRNDMFKFVFQLYNFVELAKEANNTLSDPSNNIDMLKMDVHQMGLPGLTSITPKRKEPDDNADNRPSKKPRNQGGSVDNDILSDAPILEALDRAGYTIPDEVEGFESLLPLTAKVLEAVSVDGKDVILKLTNEHEVEVLRRLHGNQSTKQTRIIPLLDVVSGRLMVLPQRIPLLHFMEYYASSDDVKQLALQFLEGVVYLQDSFVAHLDLKPDNIVVQRDPESNEVDLTIIDFNIAVFADAKPTISSSDGTPGWCAPEVSGGSPYDPLLADRWSCGRVLQFFTEHMKPSQMQETMRLFSQQLMNLNPSLRPKVIADLPRHPACVGSGESWTTQFDSRYRTPVVLQGLVVGLQGAARGSRDSGHRIACHYQL